MYLMWWYPRLACDGLWNFYVYKTPPAWGDTLDDLADAGIHEAWYWTYDQSVPPFDTWQLLGSHSLTPESASVFVKHWDDPYPRHYFTYFDAVRLEYVGEGGDGGASSSAVALGDVSQRVRVTPNPAGRTARISYFVPEQGRVDVVVYDVTGRAVLRAAQGIQRAGVQTATISVAGLPIGTYMARVSANGVNATCRFVVCR